MGTESPQDVPVSRGIVSHNPITYLLPAMGHMQYTTIFYIVNNIGIIKDYWLAPYKSVRAVHADGKTDQCGLLKIRGF
jgi:hypothetical protein